MIDLDVCGRSERWVIISFSVPEFCPYFYCCFEQLVIAEKGEATARVQSEHLMGQTSNQTTWLYTSCPDFCMFLCLTLPPNICAHVHMHTHCFRLALSVKVQTPQPPANCQSSSTYTLQKGVTPNIARLLGATLNYHIWKNGVYLSCKYWDPEPPEKESTNEPKIGFPFSCPFLSFSLFSSYDVQREPKVSKTIKRLLGRRIFLPDCTSNIVFQGVLEEVTFCPLPPFPCLTVNVIISI